MFPTCGFAAESTDLKHLHPVRQALGAALLAAGQPEIAEQMFTQGLKNYPKNGWALYGLLQAQQAVGKEAKAKETAQRFKQAWVGDVATLDLRRL